MATLAFRTPDSPEAVPDRSGFLRLLDALAEWHMRQSHRVISRAQPLNATMTGVLADGQYFGEQVLVEPESIWEFTAKAATACTVLSMPRQVLA